MKKQLINEVKQLQKTAGLLSEAVSNIPQTLTFTFKTKFILSKMNEALDGDLLPVNQIDFNKLQKELQEDLYIQIDNGFYFEELVANDGLIDFKKDEDINELHPDDPASVGIDDIGDEDPEDFDDISEGVDPIEVFNFGYDLEAVDALSNYVKSKYHVVDQQDDTTGADAAEWVERGDTTMNALEIYNPAILKDPMFKKLLQSCEGKGRFDDDGDVMENINEIDQKVLKSIEAYVDSKLGVVGSSEVVKKAINHIVAAYKKEKPTRKLGTFVKNHFDDYADRNIHYSELL